MPWDLANALNMLLALSLTALLLRPGTMPHAAFRSIFADIDWRNQSEAPYCRLPDGIACEDPADPLGGVGKQVNRLNGRHSRGGGNPARAASAAT